MPMLCLALAAMLMWVKNAHALKEPTHKEINDSVIANKAAGFNLDEYLKSRLLFPRGIEEVVANGKTLDIIKMGGGWEDSPDGGVCIPEVGRAFNHYHNPLTDNGYSGVIPGILSGESIVT